MKVSVVAVTITHEDTTDPVEAVDEILSYAINKGLYAEELGLTVSKRIITTDIDTVAVLGEPCYLVPDWDSVVV